MMKRDEIAIVGFAARLPGAPNAGAFWSLLQDNQCSVTWITPDRFPTESFYHPSPNQRGKSYTFAAGVVDDLWGFDAAAFGMSPREAEQVDPQQRHLLEVTYDALAHAGIRPSSLAGSDAAVYVGASSMDHGARFFVDPSALDVHMMTGNTLSIIANRLSYTLDIRGPSLTVDTACSSSMVALTLAADAIRHGTVDTAIVGGVNLLLSPLSFVGFSRASMLSPTGRCRPFDAGADGYVRAEGTIVLILRSMAAARKARNRVHAVIVGSGMNQDGRTTGLSLPSPDSQRQLLEQVYGDFGVDPSDLTFVEAHGTGTRVGDPIEAHALGHGLGQRRAQPLPIGSVKSNVGHLEPVSGLAGVLKSVLALEHGLVPATLHQQSPNPDIPFDDLNLRVIDRNWQPPERRGSTLVGVNSFGFGGTNAHAILRSDDAVVSVVRIRPEEAPPPLLLTAHAPEALPALAAAYCRDWPSERRLVNQFISAGAHLRDALTHRLIVHGESADEIKQHLADFAEGKSSPAVMTDQAIGSDLPVAFVFSGNGSQWAGMGRDAWHRDGRFRDALSDLDRLFGKAQSWSLVDMLFAEDLASRLHQATYSQPLLLALQIATVRVLEDSGVAAAAAVGHSVGEVAAAWAAGALSLEQAIQVVTARSRNQEVARGKGGMAALMLGEREARRVVKSVNAAGVDIAAVNSWRGVTLSGPVEEIDKVLATAKELRISAARLDVEYPFHSALVDAVREPLLKDLAGLKPRPQRRRLVSSVTGDFASGETLGADYWWRNVREPVQFEAALGRLLADGLRVFVEIGPKPILASYVRDGLRDAGVRGAIIATLTESESPRSCNAIDQAVSKVFLAGGKVAEERFFGPPPATAIELPSYPWQHAQFKLHRTAEATNLLAAPSHPILGMRVRNESTEWFSTVDPLLFPWIADHKVGSIAVFPAAGYVDALLAVAREIHGSGALELRDLDIVHPLVFEANASFETLIRASSETGITEFLSRPRGVTSDWILNARGVVGRAPVTAKTPMVPLDAAGTVIVPKERVYEIARTLGFDYGSIFRRVRQVSFPTSTTAAAPLDARHEHAPEGEVIDVTGVDAAFHALFASEEAGVADIPMKRMLPIHFGCVRVFAPGVPAARALAHTAKRSATSILAEVDLIDEKGNVILSAQDVRLIDAPPDLALDPSSLLYTTRMWKRDRAAISSTVRLTPSDQVQPSGEDAPALAEALLLLEAGCLRAACDALQADADGTTSPESATSASPDEDAGWRRLLRSALIWHLDSRNLVIDGAEGRIVSPDSGLPDVNAIVSSLLERHPTMAGEAASLARIGECLGQMMAGGEDGPNPVLWRQLTAGSSQISSLRHAMARDLTAALMACDRSRLVRLLQVGAEHLVLATDLCERFPNIELTITDIDVDQLEQARAALGDDTPRIGCVPWDELAGLPGGTIDLAFSIDALSEMASVAGGLASIARLLRPNAPVIAAELSPSVFWDVIRGNRPTWWARSVNRDFPVGALLTSQEWIDEFELAGFHSVRATPAMGEDRIGVVLHAFSAEADVRSDRTAGEMPIFAWEGAAPKDGGVLDLLSTRLAEPVPAESGGTTALGAPPSATDVIWATDAGSFGSDTVDSLCDQLAHIAERARRLAEAPARLWIVMDFGGVVNDPLEQPLWCALTAAMRVVQNEYSSLRIRCLGLAGSAPASVVQGAARELLTPDDEREVFLNDGVRTVSRAERDRAASTAGQPLAEGMALRLRSKQGTSRGVLVWQPEERVQPAPREVEIEVATSGLNFRDVMWNLRLLPEEALEDGYAGAGLGMECAGTVSATGPDVDDLKVGDRVVAFVPGAFSTHALAPRFAVQKLAPHLSFEAATTLPVAFLTAYYSLVHLARLREGETVLIHGGAGAVGLAAIQIAQQCGAIVIATAGTEEKRALLRSLGVDLVCNSRTLSFVEEVGTFTDSHGVDVVLNSLAGEAMVRSIDCLKPFGRFVELGKRDFYTNTHIGLRPMRRNLSYHGVDVDQLIGGHQDLAQRLFTELLEMFEDGKLLPLPHQVFPGDRAGDAFRLMQRSGHIGKIVLTPAKRATNSVTTGRFPVDDRGLHVVIGGTSGFGLATAQWLADRGAMHLLLLSRSGRPSEDAEAAIDELQRKGVDVAIAAVDVTDRDAVEQALQAVAIGRPIKGIVHAAMAIDDRLIEKIDRKALQTVIEPKVAGALHLERLARGLELDYLLLYSSATTMIGNPGQYNYVAANAFMEGLACRMRRRGLPALAVAWGGIEDTGYLSRNIGSNPSLKKRFASSLMSAKTALDSLDLVYDDNGRQRLSACTIARIDWAMAQRDLQALKAPTFSFIGSRAGSRQGAAAAATLEKLRGMSTEQAAAALVEMVVDEIARVLRLPPKQIDRHRPLTEIGMDSLMMLELRTMVEEGLQVELPMMSLSSGITATELAHRIAPLVTGESQPIAPSNLVTLSGSHFAADVKGTTPAEHQAAIEAVLEKVSDVESLR